MGSALRDVVLLRTLSNLASISIIRSVSSSRKLASRRSYSPNNPIKVNRRLYSSKMNGISQAANNNCSESHTISAPTLAGNETLTRCSTLWNPLNIFTCPSSYKHALIILNRPLIWRESSLINIWEKASVKVTVDGGTDQWIKFLGSRGEAMVDGKSRDFIPDLITGDMDSISPDTLDKMRRLGASVIHTPDQNDTDYTKALIQLGVHTKSKGINLDGVYVFSETSGRLDHILANINTLFKSDKLIGDVQLTQVSSNSLTWLLRPGRHSILIPEQLIKQNSWCALMPVGCRVTSITTTGLKWNLESSTLEFGGMVSTSNTYSDSPEVTITTDTPVLWSMDIEPLTTTMSPES